ncbi:MAG: hypothetical protein QXW82_07195 [Candidatus Bathyarchaeia archaeon]
MKRLKRLIITATLALMIVQLIGIMPQQSYGSPALSFEVVDAYFSPAAYPGTSNTNLYMVLNNTSGSDILYAIFNVTLPEGFTIKEPTVRVSTRIGRGDFFTVRFTGVSIPLNAQPGPYIITVKVNATTASPTPETTEFSAQVLVETLPPEEPIMLAAVNVLYRGSPSPLLPSAKNVVIRIYLANKLAEAVNSMVLDVSLPAGIYSRAIAGTYIEGMAPGGSCYVDVTVDVSPSAHIGRSYGQLDIMYTKTVSGTSTSIILSQLVDFPLTVESVHSYMPQVSLLEAYWGSPEPAPVYTPSRYVPLTAIFVNEGRYSVQEVVVTAFSSDLRPIKDSELFAATLASGDSCTGVLYFDVNTSKSSVDVSFIVSYKFTDFGVHIAHSSSFTATLPVESYPAFESFLSLVAYGWQNNYNVFPMTENAVFQVTLANRAPYPISGVKLTLKLPEGMVSKGKNESTAYFDGPLQSLDTFTVGFTVSVGDVSPGSYNATLAADFIILSGGPGVRQTENFTLTMDVNNDSHSVELVDSRWYEGSVGPNTYGVHLMVLVRNVYVDVLKGAVLELELPEGIRNAADNSSIVRAAPLSMQLPQPLQAQSLPEILGSVLSAQQAAPVQAYSRGDILTFTATLNIFDVKPGNYAAEGKISYVDAWGGKRQTPITVSMPILGRVEYIEILVNGSLSVRSRYVNTSLTVINHGTSPIYDAYVIVTPHQGTPILIASPAVSYVERIPPEGSYSVPVLLAYNPLGFYSQAGGVATVTYGPVPFMISVIYRDASGYTRTSNNSITIIVEPFIDLVLRDVRAVGTNVSSTVTGIIVNHGSSTAYRVEAELRIGNRRQSAFIGDVDPGSEVAFRVDLDTYNSSAILTINYYNVFDELESRELPVNVKMEVPPPPEVKEQPLPIERWIIIAGVIVFLTVAALLIYRMFKKSKLEANAQRL